MNLEEFNSLLISIADKKVNLYLHGEELYSEKLYEEANKLELRKADLKTWIENRLFNDFSCLGKRPKWLYEPKWPFFNNKPMTFVTQAELPKSEEFPHKTIMYIFQYTIKCIKYDGQETGYCLFYQDKRSTTYPVGYIENNGSIYAGSDKGRIQIFG